MPEFYLVPYPTGQDLELPHCRRSRTTEYAKMFKACKKGILTLETYRWGLYIFGGESQVCVHTPTTDNQFTAILARHQEDRDAFRATLIEQGYTDLTDRAAEYNIYAPHDLFDAYPCGKQITREDAQAYLKKFPIPGWINRKSAIYRGWELHPEFWKGQKKLADFDGKIPKTQSNLGSDSITVIPVKNASPTTIHGPLEMRGKKGESAAEPINLLYDPSDKEGLTNPRAPTSTIENNRPAKRTRFDLNKEDTDVQQPTSEEEVAFFRTLAQALATTPSQHGATSLSSDCPAVKAVREGYPIISDGHLVVPSTEKDSGYDIQLTMLYDNNVTAVAVPTDTAKYVMGFITFVQHFDKNNLTTIMPTEFILRHFVRVKQDFDLVRLLYKVPTNDEDSYRADLNSTMAAWKRQHSIKITHASVDKFKARLIAMRRYLEEYGVVKAFALKGPELSRLAQSVTEADMEEVFGHTSTGPTLMEELMER
ncbi:hypothetical protein VSDG_06806 [Cytospora chrysosperma]|uniref:Uncharacterized protein n=1 Tax=Cytospora chrysosperma TaxID=252740 RepID=A0A423VR70_CYTCH|nr:hypothetical protein VSDG_06806 [Valsa sordida]